MPRAGLTRLRVISEARQLVDRIGLDQLTMTALAHHLGVKQPSLYKHVTSLAELHRTIATIAARELGNEIDRAAHGLTGSIALRAVSHAYRNWATLHPGHYRASQMPPAPGDFRHQATVGAAARTFAAAIATTDATTQLDRTRAVRATLHGFVTLESTQSFGPDTDIDRSFHHAVRGLELAFAAHAVPPIDDLHASLHSRTTPRMPTQKETS